MRFNPRALIEKPLWRALTLSLVWLFLISGLHYWLNYDHSQRRIIKMGYMPVITNLSAPILDAVSTGGNGVRFKAIKFSSFAEMAESLRNGHIEVAFIIAPLSIVLRQQGEDVKVIYIGNRHESTMVVRAGLGIKTLADLTGRKVAVPMRYSGHNIALRGLLAQKGLEDRVSIVEMNPPDMAAALATGGLDAYFVGEPFAAKTLQAAQSKLFFYVEDIWPNFICNLVIVKQSLIEREPETVAAFVKGAVRAGIWARDHVDEAAEIAAKYWNQPVDLVKYAMTNPPDRIVYDRFIPKEEELGEMARLMVQYGLSEHADIAGLIEDRFAKDADIRAVRDRSQILR